MSGINIVVGPPGAGKGLWLIQVVRDILLDSNQTIITNFAVKLPELNAWLQENHPEQGIDLHERIHFLELDEIKRFYLVRGSGRQLQGVTREQERQNTFPDYEPCKQWPSVCYILDEADIHFGAREYADHGRSVNFYNKQHRKLGDTVYYCCQSAEQLDKQIRLLAQQTIVLKNLAKQRKGIFSLPAVFCWSAYYQVPKLNDRPMASGVFRLHVDHGLQNCFETAAGVGLAGMKADRDERRKGLSLLWAIPALVLAGLLIVKAPMLLARGLSGATIGAAKVAADSYKLGSVITNQTGETSGLFANVNPERSKHDLPQQASLEHVPTPGQDSEKKTNKVHLTGICSMNGRVVVFLSDGEVFTSDDRELQFVSRHSAIIGGKKYLFAPPMTRGRMSTELGRPGHSVFGF